MHIRLKPVQRPRRDDCWLTGFRLVELLVVIAIIGILIALVCAWSAGGAQARFECINHLKQMGLAFQMHHETHLFFPTVVGVGIR